MTTIEDIRLANFHQLVDDLKRTLNRTPSQVDISRAFGISTVYVHLLSKGKRTKIDSVAARKIEAAMGKETGWMDHEHSLAAWPFQLFTKAEIDSLPDRVLGRIEERVRQVLDEHAATASGAAKATGTHG